MPGLSIIEYPDPRLRETAAEVTCFDDGLKRLVRDLLDTLEARGGIALCAPQVGVATQVIVLQMPPDQDNADTCAQVFINPTVLASSSPGLVQESCLSLPGVTGNLIRPTCLRVRAYRPDGVCFEQELSGMSAVALGHEMDHLVGKLFIDRLSFLRRLRMRLGRNGLDRRTTAQAGTA